jgi:hypothetical protein
MQMSDFERIEELRSFLTQLGEDPNLAEAVWAAGGTSYAKLAAASNATLGPLGIPAINADYLRTRAGEYFLSPSHANGRSWISCWAIQLKCQLQMVHWCQPPLARCLSQRDSRKLPL